MNIAEAFQALGLHMDATSEEVDRRFRELSLHSHPDTGGDDGRMKELLAARATAADFAASRSIVVYRPPTGTVGYPEGRREVANRAFAAVLRFHVGRLRALQRLAAFVGAIGVGASALSSRLSPFADQLEPLIPSQMAAAIGLVGIAICFAALVVQFAITALQQAVEDMQEALSDRSTFVDLLLELHIDSTKPMTVESLDAHVQYWLDPSYPRMRSAARAARSAARWISPSALFGSSMSLKALARRLGSRDFTKLVLAKGGEVQLLQRAERVEDGRLIAEYRVLLPPPQPAEDQ